LVFDSSLYLPLHLESIAKMYPDFKTGEAELTFPTIEGAEPATLAWHTKWLWLPFWQKCLDYFVVNQGS
jgi:hypothetical protein